MEDKIEEKGSSIIRKETVQSEDWPGVLASRRCSINTASLFGVTLTTCVMEFSYSYVLL